MYRIFARRHPVIAVVKEKNASTKPPKESFSEQLTQAKLIIEIGSKLFLFAGLVLVFSYLEFSIHFYPTGLTIADSFLFLLTTFAFGVAYVLFTLLGFLGVGVVQWIKRWIPAKALVLIPLCAIAYLAFESKKDDQTFLASLLEVAGHPVLLGIYGFSSAGLGLYLLIKQNSGAEQVESVQQSTTDSATRRRGQTSAIILLIVMPVLMASPFLGLVLQNFVMRGIGVRLENVTVRLTDENYKVLESGVQGQPMPTLGCSIASGSSDKLVHGVNLLWHGIGERSLVEVNPLQPNSKPLSVELKKDGIFVFHSYGGAQERCLDISGDLLFDTASAQLRRGAQREMHHLAETLQSIRSDIEEVRLIGHADPFAFKGATRKNEQLALERACEIGRQIIKDAHIPSTMIVVEGHGAREPKALCKDWPVKETLSECFAANRRVEVRIKYKVAKPMQGRNGPTMSASSVGIQPASTASVRDGNDILQGCDS